MTIALPQRNPLTAPTPRPHPIPAPTTPTQARITKQSHRSPFPPEKRHSSPSATALPTNKPTETQAPRAMRPNATKCDIYAKRVFSLTHLHAIHGRRLKTPLLCDRTRSPMNPSRRVEAVQSPVIPVIGEL